VRDLDEKLAEYRRARAASETADKVRADLTTESR
jgi:hypothetical protein